MTISFKGQIMTVSEESANNIHNALTIEQKTELYLRKFIHVYDHDLKDMIIIYLW